MGHTAVAVLDGGWQAWQAENYPSIKGIESNEPVRFIGSAHKEWLVLSDEVPAVSILIDSRAPDRFRGVNETIDPVAGHIPGAVNFNYHNNWGEDGRYLPPIFLRQQFETLLATNPAEKVVFYCGSGVSACVNLLAMAHAGLGNGRLYAGSWSDWITDLTRPITTGEEMNRYDF
jgi:thiosulfate/3-mercaptopyruvate sulfurtransferase